MCYDITLTNISLCNVKGLSLSLFSFLLLPDMKFLPSFLFVPALTLTNYGKKVTNFLFSFYWVYVLN